MDRVGDEVRHKTLGCGHGADFFAEDFQGAGEKIAGDGDGKCAEEVSKGGGRLGFGSCGLLACAMCFWLTYLVTPRGGSDARFDIVSTRALRETDGTESIA